MPCCCMLLLLIIGCPSISLILLILDPMVSLWLWCRCTLLRSGPLQLQKFLQRVMYAFRFILLSWVHRLLIEQALPWALAELLEEVLAEVRRQEEQVQWGEEDLRPLLARGSQAQIQAAHRQDCTVDTLNIKLEHRDPFSHQRSSLSAICGICAINKPASLEACLPDGLQPRIAQHSQQNCTEHTIVYSRAWSCAFLSAFYEQHAGM